MGACEQKQSVSMRLLPTEMSNKLSERGSCWWRRGPDPLLSADISASEIKQVSASVRSGAPFSLFTREALQLKAAQ